MNGINKGQWLDDLLKELEWTPAKLAHKSGLDSAVISNIKNGKRGTGLDVARKIAKATKRPEGEILRRAGLSEPVPKNDELAEKIFHDLNTLLPEDKQDVLEFIKFKVHKASNHKK